MNTRRRPGSARVGPVIPARTRRWLYSIAAAATPLVTVYGLVTEEQAVLWLNLLGAVLFTVAVGNTPSRQGELEGSADE